MKWNMFERQMPWIESVFMKLEFTEMPQWVEFSPQDCSDIEIPDWGNGKLHGTLKDWWGICFGVSFSFVINTLPRTCKCTFNSSPIPASSTCLIFIVNKPASAATLLWPGGQDFTKREDEYVVATEILILTSVLLLPSRISCSTVTAQQLHKSESFQHKGTNKGTVENL